MITAYIRVNCKLAFKHSRIDTIDRLLCAI